MHVRRTDQGMNISEPDPVADTRRGREYLRFTLDVSPASVFPVNARKKHRRMSFATGKHSKVKSMGKNFIFASPILDQIMLMLLL